MSGILQYSNVYAIYLSVLLFLSLYNKIDGSMKRVYELGCYLFTLGILLTYSRITWVATFFVILLFLFMKRKEGFLYGFLKIAVFSGLSLTTMALITKGVDTSIIKVLIVFAFAIANGWLLMKLEK